MSLTYYLPSIYSGKMGLRQFWALLPMVAAAPACKTQWASYRDKALGLMQVRTRVSLQKLTRVTAAVQPISEDDSDESRRDRERAATAERSRPDAGSKNHRNGPGHRGAVAIRIVGAAVTAPEADNRGPTLNFTDPSDEVQAQLRASAPGKNETLEDVIKREKAEAVANQSAQKVGKKAWSREQQGRKTPKQEKFEEAIGAYAPNGSISDELNNETIQQAIRERVKEAVDEEVVEKETVEHRLPSDRELNHTVRQELKDIWYDMLWSRRHKHKLPAEARARFWWSVEFFDWGILSTALVIFVTLYHQLLDWPSTKLFHGSALLIWVAMAALYNSLIYIRLGEESSTLWLVGYLLEFIFSIENLFVFHIIVKNFRMPRWITQKVLFIVVLCQVAFQFVFYMGLAVWLRSLKVLPYLLGLWLIYVGWQAMMEEEHQDFDIMQSRPVALIRRLLGERIVMTMDDAGALFVTKGGKTCVSPAGLLLFCVLLADFLLEIDVTVTKIEAFPSRYICFSSSMVASFALPELFFVARDLFHRFFGLKYGVSFVLIFFGLQALLHEFFTLTALASLAIIVSVIILSIVISAVLRLGKGFIGTEAVGPREVE